MLEEIIVAGSGGQGVMLLGEALAFAAINRELKATWLPSYGPEMMGGTANCSVVISSEEIASPIVEEPLTLICFNLPSLNKFASTVKSGGLIIIDESIINKLPDRSDVEIISIKAKILAQEIGNDRMANMILLGAYLAKKPIVDLSAVFSVLPSVFGPSHAKIIPINRKAIQAGYDLVKKMA